MKFPKQAADETGTTSRNEHLSAEQTLRQRNRLASLERGIERRDSEVDRLTKDLANQQRAAEVLQQIIEKSQARISDLEQGFEERMAKCRELREALTVERERADAAEAALDHRDNPQSIANTARRLELPSLEALMEDDSYMRETLALDEDTEALLATTTANLSKTFPDLNAELVAAELIFPGDGDEESMSEDGEPRVSVADKATPTQTGPKFERTLAIVLDEGTPIRHPIYKPSMTIGRSRDADIQIASDFISRVHARIVTDNKGTFIEDAGSKNGVKVNGVRADGQQRIADGDSVRLGRVGFKIVGLDPDEDD